MSEANQIATRPLWVSDRFVQFVGIVFGVVVVQSFVRYDTYILNPFSSNSIFPFLALIGIYITTTSSWIGYHRSMNRYPYDTKSGMGTLRMHLDLFIVAVYAFLLFSIQDLSKGANESSLLRYLWGYFAMWPLYLLVGIVRQKEKKQRKASFPGLLLIFGVVHLILAFSYPFAMTGLAISSELINWFYLGSGPVVHAIYRLVRYRHYLG